MILETIPIFQSSCCQNLETPLLISSADVHASICCSKSCFCLLSLGQRAAKVKIMPGVRAGAWLKGILLTASDYGLQAYRILNLEILKSSNIASSMHSIRRIQILSDSTPDIFFLLYNQSQITLAKCKPENLEITEIGSFYASESIIGIRVLSESRILVFQSDKSVEISTSQFANVSRWFLSNSGKILSSDIYENNGIWVNDTGLVTFRRGNFVKTLDSKQIGDFLGVKQSYLVDQICFFSRNCVVFKFQNGMVGLVSVDEVYILILNCRVFPWFKLNIRNYFIPSQIFKFYKMIKCWFLM